MSDFGTWGSYPFSFGGDPEPEEAIYASLLLAYSPEPGLGFDPTDPMLIGELAAYADAVGSIWDINERVRRQALPLSMIEALPDAEAIYGLRPTPQQSDNERRAAVAGKVIALRGNAMPDIEEAVRAIAGAQFVAIETVAPGDGYNFWPLNPGPPGMEFSSSNCFIRVQLTKAGLPNDAAYERLRAAVINQLQVQTPASHIFAVSTGTGFLVEISLLDEAGL